MSNNINTTEAAAAADPMVDELAIAVSGGTLSNIKLDSESQIMVIGVGGAGGLCPASGHFDAGSGRGF